MNTFIPSIDIDCVRDPFNVSIGEMVDLNLPIEINVLFKNDRTLQLKFKEYTFNRDHF